MKEQWKPIEGFPYMISNHGRVKSFDRKVKDNKGFRIEPGRIMKPETLAKGYFRIGLARNNKQHRFLIHSLVMKYFGPPRPSKKHQVNHINFNKEDNRIKNLEWRTNRGNCIHFHEANNVDQNMKEEIKRLREDGVKQNEICDMFGISRTTVHRYQS